jgi:hypothetical protein
LNRLAACTIVLPSWGLAFGEAPRNETSPTLNYRRAFPFSYAASRGLRRSELSWTIVPDLVQNLSLSVQSPHRIETVNAASDNRQVTLSDTRWLVCHECKHAWPE